MNQHDRVVPGGGRHLVARVHLVDGDGAFGGVGRQGRETSRLDIASAHEEAALARNGQRARKRLLVEFDDFKARISHGVCGARQERCKQNASEGRAHKRPCETVTATCHWDVSVEAMPLTGILMAARNGGGTQR